MNTSGKAIVSSLADPRLSAYLELSGFEVLPFGPLLNVAKPVSCHPDLLYCGLSSGFVFEGDPGLLGSAYPADVRYNACSTGKYFIHNLQYTDPLLLGKANELGLTLIDVKQGYSKCSVVVVDEDHVITYDRGIAEACRNLGGRVFSRCECSRETDTPGGQFCETDTPGDRPSGGPDVLLVETGHVLLPGYDTGFIGGASATLNDRVIFNGDLSAHPDFERIVSFCGACKKRAIFFKDYPLTDIGSVVFCN